MVQEREMRAARSPEVLAQGRYRPSAPEFDHPLRYRPVDGEHDVFGDGTAVLIPTYGHTPGHQSLLVRPGGRGDRIVFTADACSTRENMDRDVLPTILWDEAEMSHSSAASATSATARAPASSTVTTPSSGAHCRPRRIRWTETVSADQVAARVPP